MTGPGRHPGGQADEPASEFSRPVAIKDLKTVTTRYEIAADPAEREALARRFGLPAIARLEASAAVTRLAGDAGVRIEGRIRAEVTYVSVVSLEEFKVELDEPFGEVLASGEPAHLHSGAEVEVLPDEEEMGAIVGGAFDLGEIVAQNLALMLDPHPRRADELGEIDGEEAVVWGGEDEPAAKENPFGSLAQLRDRMTDRD